MDPKGPNAIAINSSECLPCDWYINLSYQRIQRRSCFKELSITDLIVPYVLLGHITSAAKKVELAESFALVVILDQCALV